MLLSGLKERLKEARSLAGLTQKSAAKSIGVHHITYAFWEGGRSPKSADHLRRAASALGVRFEWLAEGSGPQRARRATKVES